MHYEETRSAARFVWRRAAAQSQEAFREGRFEIRWYAVLVAGRLRWAGEWPREFVLEESEEDRRSGRRITMFCFVYFEFRYLLE